jgi:hypothetical protein
MFKQLLDVEQIAATHTIDPRAYWLIDQLTRLTLKK